MVFDNTTSYGNGPRKIIRDYLGGYYDDSILRDFFGLSKYCERYYLEEELDEISENEFEYSEYAEISLIDREIDENLKHYIKNKINSRETVRDFLNGYRVTKQELMNYFGIVKCGNCYLLFEELKYR